jgi:hypothetical protein
MRATSTRRLRTWDWIAGIPRAWIDIMRVDIWLRRGNLSTTLERIERMAPGQAREYGPIEVQQARRYARRLKQAAWIHPVHARCLHQSLALHRQLRMSSLPSEFRIGVRKEGSSLYAHAWVELGGRIVTDQRASIGAFIPLSISELHQSSFQ